MTIFNLMLGRGRGGIEQACVDYTEALTRAGLAHYTLTRPDAAIRPVLEAQSLPHLPLPNRAEWDPICILRLRLLIRKHNATAIIAHGNRAVSIALRAAKGRIAVYGVAHNYKLKRFAKLDHAIAISHALEERLLTLGLAPDRIHRIPNVVRVPDLPPRAALRHPAIIGAMGRFVAKKGFEILIDAIALLHARGIPVRCRIGGDGELREAYAEKIQRLGMGRIITLEPWVEDKNRFFDGLDVFVLPSHHEPFGIVLLEAMARGVPVISTRSEGPREILADGVTGRLTSLASAESLADAIEEALLQPEATLARARAARAEIEAHYTLDVMAKRLQAALKGLPSSEG